jgi:hypothetical protein
MSKRNLTYKDFKKYFSNNLQNKDKQAFEKQIMQDAFEEEAFDGLSSLSQTDLENDLNELKNNVTTRSKRNKRFVPVWFRYAASIILIIGISATIIVFLNNRVWNDSLLNDQISLEMEIADSVLFDSELAITKQTIDSARKELIASNKEAKSRKKNEEIVIVEDKMNFINEETDSDSDFFQEELVVVEEAKELVNEPILVMEMAEIVETPSEEMVNKDLQTKPLVTEKTSADNKKITTIKGKVLGAEDNLSIPGVSIVLKDNPNVGTTTNIDGEFELTIPLDDDQALKKLIASFVGMESTEINLKGDSNLLVYMEASYLEMDEVIVTAYGIKRDTEDLEPVKFSAKPPQKVRFSVYKKQILENLDFSKLIAFPGKHKIKVTFTVNSDGSLVSFSFKNHPDQVFCGEIVRVMRDLGKWVPATENNSNISSEVKFFLIVEVVN